MNFSYFVCSTSVIDKMKSAALNFIIFSHYLDKLNKFLEWIIETKMTFLFFI